MSLFKDRVSVAIADSVRTGIQSLTDETATSTSMAMAGRTDVSFMVKELIRKASESKSFTQRGDLMMKAFWTAYCGEVKLPHANARLLINPPEDLKEGTADYELILNGNRYQYGNRNEVKEINSRTNWLRYSVKGITEGYFDDVVIFWDKGISDETAKQISSYVLPGSTVTMIRPTLSEHGAWMGWANLPLDFTGIVAPIKADFKLVVVEETETTDISTIVYGIEGK